MSSKVYLVASENYFGDGARGVFTTLEAATTYAAERSAKLNIECLVFEHTLGAPELEVPQRECGISNAQYDENVKKYGTV